MTLKVTIRQTIEYVVEVDDAKGHEYEVEWFNQELAEGRVDVHREGVNDHKVLITQVVSREHEINYSLDVDNDREVHILLADGENVFEHRDHNEVVRHWAKLTGKEVVFVKESEALWNRSETVWFDYGDPDAAWDIIKGRNGK